MFTHDSIRADGTSLPKDFVSPPYETCSRDIRVRQTKHPVMPMRRYQPATVTRRRSDVFSSGGIR